MLIAAGRVPQAVITQPDRPGKRGKRPIPSPVKALALAHDLPLLQPERLRARDLPATRADLLIVVAYGQILRQPVLDWPTLGCVNVHASLLPRWRGAAPIQRALLAGDAETGVCIMQMDAGLDTGDVLATKPVPITPSDTTSSLEAKLATLGAPLLMSVMDTLEQGTAQPVPQPGHDVTYASKIEKDEATIDWNQAADEVARTVRAFEPAVASIDGMRLKLWQVEVVPTDHAAAPGEILESSKQGIRVAAGDGAVVIRALQLPVGKGRVMTAADALNSRGAMFAAGARFDTPSAR